MGQRFREAFAARWCPSGKATRRKVSNHVSHGGGGVGSGVGCKISHSEWPKWKRWAASDGVGEKQSELSQTTGRGADSISCV